MMRSALRRFSKNPFPTKQVAVGASTASYYDLQPLKGYDSLPFSIRVLLESAVRNYDEEDFTQKTVDTILDWKNTS